MGHHDKSATLVFFLSIEDGVQGRSTKGGEQHADADEVNNLVDLNRVHIMGLHSSAARLYLEVPGYPSATYGLEKIDARRHRRQSDKLTV